MGRPRRGSESARPSRNYVHGPFYDRWPAVSAAGIRAWKAVTRQCLEDALARLHADDRPSYDATVAVGMAIGVLTNAKKGYCDATALQIYDELKGTYGESVIRNALWALQVAGVVVQVKGGTIGKDGKGRGAHRVLVGADTHSLIPADYVPPLPRRAPDTGHDLSQTRAESDTGRRDSDTGRAESDTGHDLSTPKESISSSTAALAGRSTTEESLGQVDSQESEMPPACHECESVEKVDTETDALVRAVMADQDLMRGTSTERRKTLKKDAAYFSRVLQAHHPGLPPQQLVPAMKATMRDRKDGKNGVVGPMRHGYILEVAARLRD